MPPKGTRQRQKTLGKKAGANAAKNVLENGSQEVVQTPQAEKLASISISHLHTAAICSIGSGTTCLRAIVRPAPVFGFQRETMVKVLSAGFHPIDQKKRGSVDSRQDWSVPGNDIAGVVLDNRNALPSSNILQQRSTRIFGQSKTSFDSGSLQEVAMLDLDFAAPIPDNINYDEASTLPSLAFAAYFYLFHPSTLDMEPPSCSSSSTDPLPSDYKRQCMKSLVVINPDNNLGRLVLQFASIAGISTIIAVGRIQDLVDMKVCGATHLLNIESLKTADDIQKSREDIEAISQCDLSRIVDTTNSDVTLAACLLNTCTGGTIVGPFARSIDFDRVSRLPPPQTDKLRVIRGLYMDAHKTGSFGYKFWKNIPTWLKSGQLRPTSRYESIPGGLNAEIVNKKLNEMGKCDDGPWQSYVVHPWDESPNVEISYMRDCL